MLPVLLAVISSVLHAANNILIKKGLAYSDAHTAVISTLGINALLMCIVALIYSPIKELWRPAVLMFVLVGIFHPGLTRFLTVKGVERIGVALAIPLRSTTPVFSAGFAILLLGERVTIPILWGTILIVIGVVILSYRKGAVSDVRVRFIMFPIFSAAIAALSTVFYKIGMKDSLLPYPLLAGAVSVTTSFLVITMTGGSARWRTFSFNRRCMPFYICAGIGSAMATISNTYALFLGKVIIISPISNTVPLFILVFAAIFLRDVERVTISIVMGAIMVVLGAVIISVVK
jgi:uncharacterized membrane protein